MTRGQVIAERGAAVALKLVWLAVGAITGRRTWALGAGAGIAVFGSVTNAIGNTVSDLDWLHAWSPYSWAYANEPLMSGWDAQVWLLYGASALLAVAGWLVFRARDVSI